MKEGFFFGILGLCSLLPWNAIISVTKYYDERLAGSIYETNYESTFSITYNVTGLILNVVMMFFHDYISDYNLVYSGFLMLLLNFSGFITLIFIHSLGVQSFMFLTIIFIVLNGFSLLFFLTGGMRIASKTSDSAITSFNTGQGVAGIFITLINYLVQSFEPWEVAFVNFFITFLLILSSFLLFINKQDDFIKKNTSQTSLIEPILQRPALQKKILLFKSKFGLISLSMVFIVTLSIFPSLSAQLPKNIVATQFLIYNLFDFFGRVTTFFYYPKSEILIIFLCFLRISLLPCFYSLVNDKNNDNHIDIWIISTILHIVLGLSNGFLSTSSIIIIISKLKEKHEIDFISTVIGFTIIFGLSFGSILSMFFT